MDVSDSCLSQCWMIRMLRCTSRFIDYQSRFAPSANGNVWSKVDRRGQDWRLRKKSWKEITNSVPVCMCLRRPRWHQSFPPCFINGQLDERIVHFRPSVCLAECCPQFLSNHSKVSGSKPLCLSSFMFSFLRLVCISAIVICPHSWQSAEKQIICANLH